MLELILANSSIHTSFFLPASETKPSIFLNEPSNRFFSPSIPSVNAPVPLLQPNPATPKTVTNRIQNL